MASVSWRRASVSWRPATRRSGLLPCRRRDLPGGSGLLPRVGTCFPPVMASFPSITTSFRAVATGFRPVAARHGAERRDSLTWRRPSPRSRKPSKGRGRPLPRSGGGEGALQQAPTLERPLPDPPRLTPERAPPTHSWLSRREVGDSSERTAKVSAYGAGGEGLSPHTCFGASLSTGRPAASRRAASVYLTTMAPRHCAWKSVLSIG